MQGSRNAFNDFRCEPEARDTEPNPAEVGPGLLIPVCMQRQACIR